jgi:hypothetical protein
MIEIACECEPPGCATETIGPTSCDRILLEDARILLEEK